MKEHLQRSIGLILLFATVLACTDTRNRIVTIRVSSKSQPHVDVKLYHNNYLEETVLAKSKTDSLGNCILEVAVQNPMLARLVIGEKYGEVYLSRECDLTIQENANHLTPLTFSGKCKEINNGISWFNSTFERIRWGKGDLPALSRMEYQKRLDSLNAILNDFNLHYRDSITLTATELEVLENKNKIKVLSFEQEYAFLQYNQAIVHKWNALKSGEIYDGEKIIWDFEPRLKSILSDTSLLAYGDYQVLLNFFWQNNFNLPTTELIGPGGSYQLATLKSDSLINTANLPRAVREYLRAFNLRIRLMESGITAETDLAFANFKRDHGNSKYLPPLNETYQEWLALAPGKAAPDFIGTTPDGKQVSLSDLKGKVVYVDVWATWCAPCREEIPFSKILQQKFSEGENVLFLNVSLDQDTSAWRQFLKTDKSWRGLHIILDPEMRSEFHKSYKLYGVPEYFFIGGSGNILLMKAPPPSNENTSKLIKKYLAEDN